MIRDKVIRKIPLPNPPNLIDYAQSTSQFSWDQARNEMQGLPLNKGLNIAHEAVDRHANGDLKITWPFVARKNNTRKILPTAI